MAPTRRARTRFRLPALAALAGLVPALVLACGGSDSTTGLPEGEPTASEVSVSPEAATAEALDITVEFQATVLNSQDEEIGGAPVSWSSSDTDVAEVDGDGVATALANGTAEIEAESNGVTGTAVLTVDQAVASVTVDPSPVTLDAPGDTAHLSAEAADANGNTVEDAAFEWSSEDPSVATVDDEGVVTAESDGEVQISVTAEEITERINVAVGQEPTPEPAVSSVTPTPLQEGQSATVTGSGFASDPADNTVLVDGVEATVTSASGTSLQITVPTYECLPARDVALEVQTSGGSSGLTEALSPDETPVSLAVGQQLRIENPDDFCLQFEETASSERYLLGVQSLSAATAGLTPVTVTSEAADGGGAAATAPVSLAADGGRFGGASASLSSGPREAHREAERRLRTWERRNLDLGAASGRSTGDRFGVSAIIDDPSTIQVGDTVDLRVPDIGAGDLCANYFDVGGVVVAEGQRGIFVADTTNPGFGDDNVGFTDTDYQNFSDRLDDEIGGRLVDYFGVPPELQDERVIVLVSGTVNQSSSALGFVFSGDLFPRESDTEPITCESSDEAAIYYARAPDPSDELEGEAYPTDRARAQTPFIMAHEITHIIQNGLRLGPDGPGTFMSSVLAEAQATLAEEVVGHEVLTNSAGNDYGHDEAFGTEDGTPDGTAWYSNAFIDLQGYFGAGGVAGAPDECGWWHGDASPCFARSLWYGVGWSFLRWASDHHASGDGSAFHQNLILAESATGGEPPIQPVSDVLGVPLEELMAKWSAALYVDGRVSGAAPELTIPSWDLFDIQENGPAAGRLAPLEEDFADWQANGEIRASSAGYVAIDGADRPATAIRIRDDSDGILDATMQAWLVRLE